MTAGMPWCICSTSGDGLCKQFRLQVFVGRQPLVFFPQHGFGIWDVANLHVLLKVQHPISSAKHFNSLFDQKRQGCDGNGVVGEYKGVE